MIQTIKNRSELFIRLSVPILVIELGEKMHTKITQRKIKSN